MLTSKLPLRHIALIKKYTLAVYCHSIAYTSAYFQYFFVQVQTYMKHTGKIFLQTVYAYTIISGDLVRFFLFRRAVLSISKQMKSPLHPSSCRNMSVCNRRLVHDLCTVIVLLQKTDMHMLFFLSKYQVRSKYWSCANCRKILFLLIEFTDQIPKAFMLFQIERSRHSAGSTSISPSEKSVSSNSRSASTMILCAPLICFCPVIEIVSTSILALRIISTTVNPSISSNPSQKNVYFQITTSVFYFFFSFPHSLCYNHYSLKSAANSTQSIAPCIVFTGKTGSSPLQ